MGERYIDPRHSGITFPNVSPYYSNGSSLAITGNCSQGNRVNLTGDDDKTHSAVPLDFDLPSTRLRMELRIFSD